MLLTGCWDVEEINRRASVDSMYLDKGDTEKLKIGVVLSVPGTLLPPVVGTEQQFQKRHFLLTAEGESMVDAWSKLQAKSERNIFFGQLRALILTDDFARENINNQLDFIGRIPAVPPNTNMLVTDDDPDKLLDMKNKANNVPGNSVDYYFQSSHKETLGIPINLWNGLI